MYMPVVGIQVVRLMVEDLATQVDEHHVPVVSPAPILYRIGTQ